MLTVDQLKAMPAQTIFATGTVPDSPEGLNMTGSGNLLRWVAVRGGIYDWTIYTHWATNTAMWIQAHGDKVYRDAHIRKLVPCTDDAFKMYRF